MCRYDETAGEAVICEAALANVRLAIAAAPGWSCAEGPPPNEGTCSREDPSEFDLRVRAGIAQAAR